MTSFEASGGLTRPRLISTDPRRQIQFLRIQSNDRSVRTAMPTRLSTYNRRRIVTLQQQGKTTSQILARLREEGVTTTAKTVRKWLHRWNSNLGLEDNFRTGRNSKITMGIASFIEEQLVRDDEISSRELTYLISKRFGMKISSSTLRTFMRTKLQWTVVKISSAVRLTHFSLGKTFACQ